MVSVFLPGKMNGRQFRHAGKNERTPISTPRESETPVRALAVATLADAGTEAGEAIPALEAQLREEDNPIIRKELEKALTCLRGGAESQSRGP